MPRPKAETWVDAWLSIVKYLAIPKPEEDEDGEWEDLLDLIVKFWMFEDAGDSSKKVKYLCDTALTFYFRFSP